MDDRKYIAIDYLIKAAEQLGIDFADSAEALTVFHSANYRERDDGLCPVCWAGDSIDADTAEIAHGLLNKFNTVSGGEVLFMLGQVAFLVSDLMTFDRDCELDDDDPSLSDVSLIDFSVAAGMAIACCSKYLTERKPSNAGGIGRAKIYKHKKDSVIEIYNKMDGAESLSADAVAGEIIGKVSLSHRKISDTIRAHRKMHDAKHNAQGAE